MKYYIIQRIGYEYNDEVYHTTEFGSGTPEKVYSDKQKAQEKCDELNAKELSGIPIMEYGYSTDEIFCSLDKANKVLRELDAEIPEDSDWDYCLPKLTVENYKRLAPYLNIKFYEIVEVEGD